MKKQIAIVSTILVVALIGGTYRCVRVRGMHAVVQLFGKEV